MNREKRRMSAQSELEKLNKQAEAIEARKKALRAKVPFKVAASEYEGHPMVTFQRPGGRPMNISAAKCRIILEHADAVRKVIG